MLYQFQETKDYSYQVQNWKMSVHEG